MYLLLLLIFIISVLLYKGLQVLNYVDHVAGIMEMIPGPTPYPFVGNVFQFGLKPDEYPKKLLQYCRKYEFQGFRSLVFFQYHVILSDPAEIQTILTSTTLINKYHLYKYIRPWLGDGLLTACGARWLKHRKMILPAFDLSAILSYMQVVNKTSTKFIRKCEQFATDGKIFDVQDLVYKCTLDIVHENATGVPSNSLNGEETDIHKAIWNLCEVIHQRTFSIVKRFQSLFHLTPYYWKQRSGLTLLKKNIRQIIDERREILQNSPTEANNHKKPFLDNLLTAKIDQRPLKFNEIFQEISTFIYTGHETIASAVSFTIYTLSRHPEIQSKVAAEQQQILGTDISTTPSSSNLDAMTYLESVIRETLRLYPSVPVIARTNRKPIDINGTKIASRTTVVLCLLAMGYNEKKFPNPCAFIPERFNNSEAKKEDNEFKSVPFSAGPRGCVAEKFSLMQLKAMLSQIVRNFEILPPIDGLSAGINDHTKVDCVPTSDYDPILNIRVTLQSENGIQIRLKKREYEAILVPK